MTWSEWLQADKEIPDLEAIFACRSSAWCPPFHDAGFQKLIEEFGYSECLDCLLGQTGSGHDVCKLREWDWAEVHKEIARQDEMFAKLAKAKAEIGA